MSNIIKVPSDFGCIALLNPDKYDIYKNEEILVWDNLLDDFNESKIFLWGVPRGNWNVEVSYTGEIPEGYRSIQGSIVSEGNLVFMTHDELSYAAMDRNSNILTRLPEEWKLATETSRFVCTVVQLYDPERRSDESVWDEVPVHYHLSLVKDDAPVPPVTDFPWEDYILCF